MTLRIQSVHTVERVQCPINGKVLRASEKRSGASAPYAQSLFRCCCVSFCRSSIGTNFSNFPTTGKRWKVRSRLLGLLNGFVRLDGKELKVGKGVFNDHPALVVVRVRYDELG